MIRLWRVFAVVALASPLLAYLASTQLLASERSLVGDYVCVVDANTALVYGNDKQDHAVVPALSTDEKTFFMSIERQNESDPAGCAFHEPDIAFLCYAQFKMTIKSPHLYYLWSPKGYQFYDTSGSVVQMHNDASFTWVEANARGFVGSWLRDGRCNRVTR